MCNTALVGVIEIVCFNVIAPDLVLASDIVSSLLVY